MDPIEAALERVVAAYVAAGGTTDDFDPADESELRKLRRRVAPLRLPSEIERVWRTFQGQGVPGIVDQSWLGDVDLALGSMPYTTQSRALLVIGSGRATCYVELADPDGSNGGAVWTLEEFAPEIREVAPSLAALLDATAAAWEEGVVRLSPDHPFPMAEWDDAAWDRLKARLLPIGRIAGSRPAGWLPRWLAAEGLTPQNVAPRGPTATVAELLAAGDGWTGTQTIRGPVRSIVSAESTGAEIDDGTGALLVYVPHDVDRFRLLNLGRDAELDVRRFPRRMKVDPPYDPGKFDALAVSVRDA